MASANVANTRIVSPATTVAPYYDDFNESKNFHKILFRPGYAVQARELTQLQTILQNQIERFGSHVFENGSSVIGGDIQIPTHGYDTIKLQNNYGSFAINVKDFLNKTVVLQGDLNTSTNLYDDDASIKFNVVAVTEANAIDPPTLYGTYVGTSKFADGATVKLEGEQEFAFLKDADAHSLSSLAFINDSIYFINGYFVKVPAQACVMSKYSTAPYCLVGLEYSDDIITETTDTSLLDPAQGFSNYQAAGAGRYQFNVILTTRKLESTDLSKFIQLARIENGKIMQITKFPVYSEIEEVLARRTYDESGNYTVRPFNIRFEPDLIDQSNYYATKLSPGKAYILGYEFETVSDSTIRLPKARTTANVDYYDFNLNYGNYVIVDGVSGVFDTSKASMFDIHCVPSGQIDQSSLQTYNQTRIGTAKINFIDYYGGPDNEDVSTRQHEFYIFDTQYNSIKSNAIPFIGNNDINVVTNYYQSNSASTIVTGNVLEEYVISNVNAEVIYANVKPNTTTTNANAVFIFSVVNTQFFFTQAQQDFIYSNAYAITTLSNTVNANAATVFGNVELSFVNSNALMAQAFANANTEMVYSNANTVLVFFQADQEMVYSNAATWTTNTVTLYQYPTKMNLTSTLYAGAKAIIAIGKGQGYSANVTSYSPTTGVITFDTAFANTPDRTSVFALALLPSNAVKVGAGNTQFNLDTSLYVGSQLIIASGTATGYVGNVVSYNASSKFITLDKPFWTSVAQANASAPNILSLSSIWLRPTNAVKVYLGNSLMNLTNTIYTGAELKIVSGNGNGYVGNVTSYNAASMYAYVDKPFYTGTNYSAAPTYASLITERLRPTNAIKLDSSASLPPYAGNANAYVNAIVNITSSNGAGYVGGVVAYNVNTRWMTVDTPIYTGTNYNNYPSSVSNVTFKYSNTSTVRLYNAGSAMNLGEEYYANARLLITTGAGIGYVGNVVSYNANTRLITVDKPFSVYAKPNSTSTLSIQLRPNFKVKVWNDSQILKLDAADYVGANLEISSGTYYTGNVVSYNTTTGWVTVDKPFYTGTAYSGAPTTNLLRISPRPLNKIKLFNKGNLPFDNVSYANASILVSNGVSSGFQANIISYNTVTQYLTLDTSFANVSVYPKAVDGVAITYSPNNAVQLYNANALMNLDASLYTGALLIVGAGPGVGYAANVTSYNPDSDVIYLDTNFTTKPNDISVIAMALRPSNAIKITDVGGLDAYDVSLFRGADLLIANGTATGYRANVVSYNANSRYAYVDKPFWSNVADANSTAPSFLSLITMYLRPSNAVKLENLFGPGPLLDLEPDLYKNAQYIVANGMSINSQAYIANVTRYDANSEYIYLDKPFWTEVVNANAALNFSSLAAMWLRPTNAVKLYGGDYFMTLDPIFYENAYLYISRGNANGYFGNVTSYNADSQYVYVDNPFPATNVPFLTSEVNIVPRIAGDDQLRIYKASTFMNQDPSVYVDAKIIIAYGPSQGFQANVVSYDPVTQFMTLDNPFPNSNSVPLNTSLLAMLINQPNAVKLWRMSNVNTYGAGLYANAILSIDEIGYSSRVIDYNPTTKYFTLEDTIPDRPLLGTTDVSIWLQPDNKLKLYDARNLLPLGTEMYRNAHIEVTSGPGYGWSGTVLNYNAANQYMTVSPNFDTSRDGTTTFDITLKPNNMFKVYDTSLFLNGANSYTNATYTILTGNAAGYSGRIVSYNTISQFFVTSPKFTNLPDDGDEIRLQLNNPDGYFEVYDAPNTLLYDASVYVGSKLYIRSGPGAGYEGNITGYDIATSVMSLDNKFRNGLPDYRSNVRIKVTGANNRVSLYNSKRLVSNTSGAYTGATLRVVDGAGEGHKYTVQDYIPRTAEFVVSPAFKERPTGNISVDFDFAEAKSFYISTAFTPGGDTLSGDSNANITVYNQNPDGSSFILEPTLGTLLFRMPEEWIAANLSYSDYMFTKKYDREFVNGALAYPIVANTNEDFVLSTSVSDISSTILENLLVVCTDAMESSRSNGEVIKVYSSVANGTMELFTGNNSEQFNATIFTKVNLRSPTYPKTKNFVGCNTLTMSAEVPVYLTGWETGSSANVYANAAQIIISEPTKVPGEPETLYLSDVVGIEKIYDLNGAAIPDADADLTGFNDVTERYDFDNGQRDTHYDHASIQLKPNWQPPKGPLLVCCYYFSHARQIGGSGYFSVDSYFQPNPYTTVVSSGVGGHVIGDGYSVIPGFRMSNGKYVNLRDCIDFRPVRKNASNTNPNYEFDDVSAPSPATDMMLSYSYFLGRNDIVVLNADRQFQRIEGTPSKYPVDPAVPSRTMVLYTLGLPPYTEYSSNIAVKFVENRRYTMRDIGQIDKRVENLEYYVTLNSLEKQAVETSITDVNGLERAKYGIFVDSFDGHSLAAKDRPDYHCAMNIVAGYVTTQANVTNFFMTANTDSSRDIKFTRNKAMLPYSETKLIVQTKASKFTPLNNFVHGVFQGTVFMLPEADIGKSNVDPQTINTASNSEAPKNDFYSSIIDSYSRNY